MKELDVKTKLLGHPVAVVGMGALLVAALIIWTQDISGWIVAVPAMFGMGAVIKASEARSEHRAWRRAWDEMGGGAGGQLSWRTVAPAIGIAIFALLIAGTANEPTTQAFVGLLALVAIGSVVMFLGAKALPKVKASKTTGADAVSVCASSGKAPDVQAAYAELPEHCRDTLGR
jgi:hypothetical protein